MPLFRRLFRLVWGGEVDRALRPVLAVSFAGSIAGSAGWVFVGIWAIKHLGADKTDLGIAYLVGAVLGAGSGWLGGHLSDHFGRRPLMLAGWGGGAIYWLGFIGADASVHTGLVYIACAGVLFSIGNSASQAMIADIVPPQLHEAGFASQRVASNLGVTMGPPIGSLFLFVGGWTLEFVGVALLAFGAFALAYRYLPHRGAYAPEGPPERSSLGLILRDRPFLVFLASGVLAWLVYVAYEVVLPVSLTTVHDVPPEVWGLLVIVNPALVTPFQLRLTRAVSHISPAVKLAVAMPLMGVPFLLLTDRGWMLRFTGDRDYHNLLDRPRDAPGRTAFGLAARTTHSKSSWRACCLRAWIDSDRRCRIRFPRFAIVTFAPSCSSAWTAAPRSDASWSAETSRSLPKQSARS